MIKLILKWLIAAGAVLFAAYIIPGIHVDGFITALIVTFILGIVGITIKPVVKIIMFPLSFISLGLFSLVINAFFFWLVARVVQGFTVDGFLAAFLGSIVVSVANYIGDKLVDSEDVL